MSTAKAKPPESKAAQPKIAVFPSELGWIAVVGHGQTVQRLVLGYETAEAALSALDPARHADVEIGPWNKSLVARLQRFARGKSDDFADVQLDVTGLTEFQRRVLAACRKVKYGKVSSYSELAIAAGAPRAARAVGTVMRKNCVPLVVPCHRILSAGGGIGGYSCPQGISMKKKLLALEAQAMAKARTNKPTQSTAKSKSRPKRVAPR
jgi:methylated-DNA-[protein]-cysteine S-methyltransferase